MKKIHISLFSLILSFSSVNASNISFYDEVIRSEGCGVHFRLSTILSLPPYYCHRVQLLGGSDLGGFLKQGCTGSSCPKANNIHNRD